MNIIFPCLIGLSGAYLYQEFSHTLNKSKRINYIRAFFIILFLQYILWSNAANASCVKCDNCKPMWIDQSDKMLENYKYHFSKCEELYENVRLIQEHHKYDFEDAFVSGTCGCIMATQISDARAKLIAISLTVIADYFKESYYCHRALRRSAESYRYEVFMMEKSKDQLLENIQMCSKCSKQYDYENYDGVGYYRYLEYWKSWYDDLDEKSNFGPGCWHTYKKTYKFSGDQ